jgi:outer membrane murein-binding lipoprotein Lpp
LKTIAAVLAVAAVTASSSYSAGQTASQGQVNHLSKQVAALSTRVSQLEKKSTAILEWIGACFNTWTPLTVYGDSTQGYVYLGQDGQTFTTEALDLTNSGDTPNFYVPAATSDCSLSLRRDLAAFLPLASHHRLSLDGAPT